MKQPGNQLPWYNFDEESGAKVLDANGNKLDATLLFSEDRILGPVNNAISLSGGQYVELPNGLVSNLDDFSITTWVYLRSNVYWMRIFDFGTGISNNMFFAPYNDQTGRPRFAIKRNGGAEQTIEAATPFPLNEWVHVALTLKADTGILYFNGEQVGMNKRLQLRPYMLGITNQNYIGKSQYADPYLFGDVDEFRIFNHALRQSEIMAMVEDTALFGYLSRDTTLKSLSIVADSVQPAFNPRIFNYDVYLPAGSTKPTQPIFEANHEAATTRYIRPFNINDLIRNRNWGYIDVTAEYTKRMGRYTLKFHVADSSKLATLSLLSFNADSIKPVFDPFTFNYEVYLSGNDFNALTPQYKLSHELATSVYYSPQVTGDTALIRNMVYIDVTAPDGVTQRRYSIHFNVATYLNHVNGNIPFHTYPNPFTESTTLQWDPNIKVDKLELFDITGKRVMVHEVPDGNEVIISGSNLLPGVYLLKYSGQLNGTLKVIKK